MAKILIAHTTYPSTAFPAYIGGAEHSQVQLAHGLATTYRHKVTVLRGLPPGSAPLDETAGNIRIISLPIRRPYWLHDGKRRTMLEKFAWHISDDFGRCPDETAKAFDIIDPDVLVLGNIIGLGHRLADFARAHDIPTLQIARDYYYVCPRQTRFHQGQNCKSICASCRLSTPLRRKSFGKFDKVVAVSHHLSLVFEKLTGRRDIVTIHNGVEAGCAQVSADRDHGLLRLGYIGRLAPEKGVEVFLRAAACFEDRVRIEIAGSGPPAYVDYLRKIAPPQTTFLGQVKRPHDFLSTIDVLVVPSLWDEPFGRVSIEAQLQKVAVIVSNRGGLPETIKDNLSGFVAEPTEDGLATAIGKFVNQPDLAELFGAAGRMNALAFSHENTISRFEAEIQGLLA